MNNNQVDQMKEVTAEMTWWERRSRLEKKLVVVTTCCLLLTAIFMVSVGTKFSHMHRSPIFNKLCLTPGCVKAAAVIIQNVNQSADPCDDFYEFACGGWKESKYLNDESVISNFDALNDKVDAQLKAIVETPKSDRDLPYVYMMKTLYGQCMNTSQIDTDGVKYLEKDIEKLGGWPVLKGPTWDDKNFQWEKFEIQANRMGFGGGYLLDIDSGVNIKNTTQRMIGLSEATLMPVSRKHYMKGLNSTIMQTWVNVTLKIFKLMGSEDEVWNKKEAIDMIEFEMKLANLTLPDAERDNFTNLAHPMSLEKAMAMVPDIDVRTLIDGRFKKFNIKNTEIVDVETLDYLPQVNALLKVTPKRVIANYLMMRVFYAAKNQLPRKYRRVTRKVTEEIMGGATDPDRWEVCVGKIYGAFSPVISSLYIRKHFDIDSQRRAIEMIKRIKDEFIHNLDKVTWMDPKTKQKAIEKAVAIHHMVGYPPEILDPAILTGHYQDLLITRIKSYYENIQSARKWNLVRHWNKLRKPIKKDDWTRLSGAATVNAYYSVFTNMILIPAGILQQVMFQPDRPDYLNYGGIGFVIGHELTHSLDKTGKQFDAKGNEKNWWEPKTNELYLNRSKCIIHQYSNITLKETFNVTSLHLDGNHTIGEDVADHGGIKVAFLAYRNIIRERRMEEPALPGTPFTPNQMFFLNAAHVWCAKYTKRHLEKRIERDSHSPPKYRVLGAMRNNPDFVRAFQCPVGSFMNPIQKCTVW